MLTLLCRTGTFILFLFATSPLAAQTLEERLREEPASRLAADAREQGDPQRGAILFHRPAMACSRCHDMTGANRHPTGPDYSTGGPIGPHTVVDGLKLADRSIPELLECIANGAGWRKRGAFLDRLVWRYRVSLRDQAKAGGSCQMSRA